MSKRLKIILAVFVVVIILSILIVKKASATALLIDANFTDFIDSASESSGIPVRRIKAMIYQESSGNTTAIGTSGERGLMQLEPGALSDYNMANGTSYTFDDMFDPGINVAVGSGYLALLQAQLGGDLGLATQAYNAGIGNVKADPLKGVAYRVSVEAKEQFFN